MELFARYELPNCFIHKSIILASSGALIKFRPDQANEQWTKTPALSIPNSLIFASQVNSYNPFMVSDYSPIIRKKNIDFFG